MCVSIRVRQSWLDVRDCVASCMQTLLWLCCGLWLLESPPVLTCPATESQIVKTAPQLALVHLLHPLFLSNRVPAQLFSLSLTHLDRRTDLSAIGNRKAHWGHRFSFGDCTLPSPFDDCCGVVPPRTFHHPRTSTQTVHGPQFSFHDGTTRAAPRHHAAHFVISPPTTSTFAPRLASPTHAQPRKQI